MKSYDPQDIEPKWQKRWEEEKLFQADTKSKKPKYYSLMEFPYPSGEGLHTGHVRGYTAMDIISRKRRMEGFNVLFPIGWDAFGLPTENYAIKTGIQPAIITKGNTDNYRKQFKSLGMSFDWSREISTTDPAFYKWTQWLFLQFLKHDLAYKAKMPINWCPKDKIGLANEEVVTHSTSSGQVAVCERCGTPVEKKEKEQWMLAITKYADRLDKDLDDVDFLPQIKTQQRNWIGKSEGAEISFQLSGASSQKEIKVFTTRPDTIFGATYLVLSPEHEMLRNNESEIENYDEVKKYIKQSSKKTEIERGSEGKEKTGIELRGIKAINPANKEGIPIWVADYVLVSYGTGAIMAVPADDKRDREFADKFSLPIVEGYKKAGFEDYGKKITSYKLRDWVFSRQRYWGEPIPVIHCEKCGIVLVPEEDLPVLLPKIESYDYTDTGESPLASVSDWVNVKCPKCQGNAKRETDTMPNWAGSSWYFLRYTDPQNDKEFASMEKLKYWMGNSDASVLRRKAPQDDAIISRSLQNNAGGVDWYNGGMEHTTLHLLYSRFWNKFLFDLKLVPTSEPYKKRTSHGFILAPNGEKMSKSRGNVINPDEIVKKYGADTLRLYEMFMGPFDQAVAWSTDGIVGPRRFLEKIYKIGGRIMNNELGIRNNTEIDRILHKTIKKVSEDIEAMSFNTAISSLMICVNEMDKEKQVSKEHFEMLLKILAPFAPHVAEEIWEELGNNHSIHLESWPKYDATKIEKSEVTIAIQVNGKIRGTLEITTDESEESIKVRAMANPHILKWVGDSPLKRVIYIKNKLLSIVI